MSTQTIHAGNLLRDTIKLKKQSQAQVARAINKLDVSVANYKKQASLQSRILVDLSHALKHNFFADFAATLPADYTVSKPGEKDLCIAALEQEVAILKAREEVLLLAFSKR